MSDHIAIIKRKVKVWDGEEPTEITVIQKSKTAWRASGEYMGERIEATGRTANSAAGTWRTMAHRKGN